MAWQQKGKKVFTVTYSVNGNSVQKVLRKPKEGRLGQRDEGSYLGSGSLLIDRILQGGSKRSSKTGGKGNNKKTMHFLALLHYQPRWKQQQPYSKTCDEERLGEEIQLFSVQDLGKKHLFSPSRTLGRDNFRPEMSWRAKAPPCSDSSTYM